LEITLPLQENYTCILPKLVWVKAKVRDT